MDGIAFKHMHTGQAASPAGVTAGAAASRSRA
jgi:hypothetical protein